MKLSEMPVVTVEQIMRFRQAAMAVEQQNASLLQEFNNVCNQRDQLEQQNTELLAALKAARSRLTDIDTAMCQGGGMAIEVWKHACTELDKALAKAGVKEKE